MDEDLLEPTGHHMSGLGVATITDVGHKVHSLELPSDSVVNTLRFSPTSTEFDISVRLMSDELLCPLLDNLWP